MPPELPRRALIFVAHPDDETIALGGLLQRLPQSLVVFATDGAPTGCGLERSCGSLKAYADLRFGEASRALSRIPGSTFNRLTRPDGSHFNDQHLFEELPDAATSLTTIAAAYSPDAFISHAYEGAHIDHDACSFLAMHGANALRLPLLEFPIYWLDGKGKVIRQQFRPAPGTETANVLEWQLSNAEVERKQAMLGEYQSQSGTVATFDPVAERMRLSLKTSATFVVPACGDYMFQERRPRFYHTRHHRLSSKVLLKKFAEFEDWWSKQNWSGT